MDKMFLIGFKNVFSSIEGVGLRNKLSTIKRELRYAAERAWKGYDSTDVFECAFNFQKWMINVLEEFNKYHECLFWVPEESEYYEELGTPEGNRRCFNEEETKSIISTMIWHLKMMDADFCEKVLFGSCIYDDDYKIGCRSTEDRKRISSVVKQNKKCFMKLFYLFYWDLWY